jgi:pyruvate ferredoxin oxidoreductase gamma subunit
MGAPVVAYVRIDDNEIELREPVLDPDLLIVQDPTLFQAIDVFAGLKGDGYVLINSSKTIDELVSAMLCSICRRITSVPCRRPNWHSSTLNARHPTPCFWGRLPR